MNASTLNKKSYDLYNLPVGKMNTMWDWNSVETPNPDKPKSKCTCGAHKAYGEDSVYHSDWCDTYEFYKSVREKDREETTDEN